MPRCLACGKTIPPDARYYWRRYCPPEKKGEKSLCQNRHSAKESYRKKREAAGKKYAPRPRKTSQR